LVTVAPILVGLMLAFAAAPPAAAADAWSSTLGEVDALFDKFAADSHAPGLIYGVVRDGRLEHVHAVGVQDLESRTPVGAETVFRIASLTKSFTALAVLKLRDEGRIDLNAPAGTVVPELATRPPPGQDAVPIRLWQLLNHSAGLVTDDPWADRQLDLPETAFSELLRAGIPLARAPGEAFDYSNLGYAILGRVISNASGRPYQDYIRHVLLRPLGMTSTVWDLREVPLMRRALGYSWVEGQYEAQPDLPDGAFGAVAGLSTTATDYGRFVAWALSAWSTRLARAPGLIDPATVREAGRASALSQVGQRANGPDGSACPVAWMYGAGFYVVTDCELGTMLRHPGGLPGYGSQVLLLPRAGVGIFAFANLTYAHLSEPVFAAALRLKRAGLVDGPTVVASAALQRAAATALRIYQSGDIRAAQDELAANVLLDRSAVRRNGTLRQAREAVGACTSIAPAQILNVLQGRFTLSCERGTVDVPILLAPTSPPSIQYVDYEPQAAAIAH
jgi:D-alanyl-D-alanine-carboxypeptidase/D-alanyl-D-alanine-endopeptidase